MEYPPLGQDEVVAVEVEVEVAALQGVDVRACCSAAVGPPPVF